MNDYLEGYKLFAGYAGKDRDVAKTAIRAAIFTWPELVLKESSNPWSEEKARGWVDAALDSVGC